MKKTYVGIDVAKAHVDLYDTATEKHIQFENSAAGISQSRGHWQTVAVDR